MLLFVLYTFTSVAPDGHDVTALLFVDCSLGSRCIWNLNEMILPKVRKYKLFILWWWSALCRVDPSATFVPCSRSSLVSWPLWEYRLKLHNTGKHRHRQINLQTKRWVPLRFQFFEYPSIVVRFLHRCGSGAEHDIRHRNNSVNMVGIRMDSFKAASQKISSKSWYLTPCSFTIASDMVAGGGCELSVLMMRMVYKCTSDEFVS